MKFYEMESIKKILGMPSRASAGQIEARLTELLAKEAELEELKRKNAEAAKSRSWWRR